MAAILKSWREAATLIIVSANKCRNGITFQPVGSSRRTAELKGDNFETLMLKRSSKSTFMPNLYVFPGGVASDADFSKDWLDIFGQAGELSRSNLFNFVKGNGQGAPMFSRIRDAEFTAIPSEIAFRICAIRETFEESGVLLARNVSNLKQTTVMNVDSPTYGNALKTDSNINTWRKRVEENASEFITMCRDMKIVPDVWSLYEWSDWLTPAHEIILHRKPRRYDTAFFLCCLEEKPDVAEDKGETVHSQWGSPLNILMEFEGGWAGIAPPQMYELARLLNMSSLEELHHFSWARSNNRIERWLPVRFECADSVLYLMPGDDLYPKVLDVYGEGEILNSSLTQEELKRKHPRHHRTHYLVDSEGKRKGRITCNIEMAAEHVAPYADFDNLKIESTDSKL
ncbi:acyl-coenzyme A diphosphatase NUDT19-like [Haliotis rufescens]|uniref:acyl-coenzyme A diphosphatase NUDT19-like n=1 Tax=Haliotis rufescens TaxID=6454 RepID=UPI001EB0A1D6|nr:acyl-coenzyme A diphosphatase NUDT19-like [Haliotis rufescens]